MNSTVFEATSRRLGVSVAAARAHSTATRKPFLMVASIGNPEPDYNGSRHSVGHWALNELVGSVWKQFQPFQTHRNIPKGEYSTSQSSELDNVFLFKSNQTLMNVQGERIKAVWEKFRTVNASMAREPQLVVVHDEILLPLGEVRVRDVGTSARGHNGLRSLDQAVGPIYTKIGIGVGKPPNKYVADYVLAKFKRAEVEQLYWDVLPQVDRILRELAAATVADAASHTHTHGGVPCDGHHHSH